MVPIFKNKFKTVESSRISVNEAEKQQGLENIGASCILVTKH